MSLPFEKHVFFTDWNVSTKSDTDIKHQDFYVDTHYLQIEEVMMPWLFR